MKIAITFSVLAALAVSRLVASDLYPSARIPDDSRDTAQRAARLVNMLRYEEAAGLYRVMIQDHPDCLYAWFNLGVVRTRQGDYYKARLAFARALSLNPNDEMSLADLGIVESELGRCSDAVQHLLAALKIMPDDPTAHEYLSQAYEKLGRHEDAQAEETKAQTLRQGQGIFQLQDVEPEDKTRNSG